MKVYILWREMWLANGREELAGVFKSEQGALNYVKEHNGILADELDDYPEYVPEEYYIIEEEPVLES